MIVYTCITGGKDRLINVNREEGVRFVCFSDTPFNHPVWEYRQVTNFGISDNRRIARMYKILSHCFFDDQTTVWVDGRIRLVKPVAELVDKYKGVVCCRPHHNRQCIYEEAETVRALRYEHPYILDNHLVKLRDIYYPENNGLHETGVLIRRKGCEEFNRLWWEMLSTGSKRDQLSFDAVAWQLGMNITPIDRADVQVTRHRRATTEMH